MLYQPSELRQFLEGLGIAPKKGLSQNFLIDGNILKKIVHVACLSSDDVIVEIGPGPGALTQALLASGATVIAIEKDELFANLLKRLDPTENQLHVICEDILLVDIETVLAPFLQKGKKAKVIANLPYHLTSAIVTKLVTLHKSLSTLILMVQDEVAHRYTASAHTKEYGSLTLFLNYHSKTRYAFPVSNHCFYPKPKVQSAVVTLDLHTPPSVSNEELFFQMTRTAFAHRRKMLRGSLKEMAAPTTIMNALKQIGKSPEARPEELTLEDFLAFFQFLN